MDRKIEEKLNQGLLEFIQHSPSVFHVIDNMKKRLKQAGFVERREQDDWELQPGGAYYVTRNDSSLIAFRLPLAADRGEGRPFKGYHIVAAHSDSPTFKVKVSPEILTEKRYVRLNVEKYGGMILSTWLDRPLSVAGRVAVREPDGSVGLRLVNLDRDLLVIPNLAVHMNREINQGYEYNPQVDMLPLMGLWEEKGEKPKIQPGQGESGVQASGETSGLCSAAGENAPKSPQGMLVREIAQVLEMRPKDILDGDLYLYVREKGRVLGQNGELILSPRLDDLQCVYAGLEGLVSGRPDQYANVLAVFDNEEWAAAPDRERIPLSWRMCCCGYRKVWALDLLCTVGW